MPVFAEPPVPVPPSVRGGEGGGDRDGGGVAGGEVSSGSGRRTTRQPPDAQLAGMGKSHADTRLPPVPFRVKRVATERAMIL